MAAVEKLIEAIRSKVAALLKTSGFMKVNGECVGADDLKPPAR